MALSGRWRHHRRCCIIGGFVAAIALGLTPSGGQPVYIRSSNQAVIPTGWYGQLIDSPDPLYLLSCSGDKVAAVPKDGRDLLVSLAAWTRPLAVKDEAVAS